jgi:hypothetical protein
MHAPLALSQEGISPAALAGSHQKAGEPVLKGWEQFRWLVEDSAGSVVELGGDGIELGLVAGDLGASG